MTVSTDQFKFSCMPATGFSKVPLLKTLGTTVVALNVYPQKVLFLGCETAMHEEVGIGLSPAVSNAIPAAFGKIIEWVENVSKN